jgi:hypothetical protein
MKPCLDVHRDDIFHTLCAEEHSVERNCCRHIVSVSDTASLEAGHLLCDQASIVWTTWHV